ncbi:helix-turn-helix domain-containing protein [Streptomyces sp. NPDC092296]|uniref:helix-turn-helix domain-containing protein n=1 Tax=Streptomyces sp. NPDC092296 TaxID=3366012 RepID=UPI0037FC7D57
MPNQDPPDWVQRYRWKVGARLRDRRRWLNLTQIRLASQAGIDHKTISRIENGYRAVNLDEMALLARALDAEPWELLRIDGGWQYPDGMPAGDAPRP